MFYCVEFPRGTETVLWCSLLFTVHRTMISWVFLPHTHTHTSLHDYSTLFCPSQQCLFVFCCPFIGLQWRCHVFWNVSSYCLCTLGPLSPLFVLFSLRTGEDSRGHYTTVFLGWGWGEDRNADVSTLYNDGQLCIYCLFIVDLYIKKKWVYYIYLYIMKYYDLVFEVCIENDPFHGPCIQSALFWRVTDDAPFCCTRLQFVTCCSILLVFSLSFHTDDQCLASLIP